MSRNNQEQVLSLLGLARRAGQLVSGESTVIQVIRNGEAQLVFFASDGGSATAKKVADKCHYYHVALVTAYDADQLSQAIGAKRKLIAVTQPGFAKKMTSLLTNN